MSATWQLRLLVEEGGVGWPRGKVLQGPPRDVLPGREPPSSVRLTGSLCCCRRGVAAACKTNLVL